MNILFKRTQTTGKMARVHFKLWGKIEFDAEEQKIVNRYRFDNAILIVADQPKLIRKSSYVGFGVFLLLYSIISAGFGMSAGFFLGLLGGGAGAYWYFNENRETILVKDLIFGRFFSCDSVVDLARKEAWLSTVVSYLRQVMESAKHWDGTETIKVDPLPKDQAKLVILRGI
ncbi:MAG: hypothetical protein HRU29_11870 [Rhizobiales bacterium]|nr:hypothetical protein [Hyphomicrobiales bacterium]NRB15086.1 hypothetical protein [Hyphomicrobiales bacterium]